MAGSAASRPSTGFRSLQIAARTASGAAYRRLETWLEAERDQLVLWVPVMVAAGIAIWFALPGPAAWAALIALGLAVALAGASGWRGNRMAAVATAGGLSLALGCCLIWWRAERAAAPVLARPAVVSVIGRVESVEARPARAVTRVVLAIDDAMADGLPPRIRVNIADDDLPRGLGRGALLSLRARLMPPAPPALPGAHDFSRVAWFERLGATGRAFAPVRVIESGEAPGADLRERLSRHIHDRLEGSAGGIAAALATGDRGGIDEADEEAMRRSGLAHLLSVSGLHVTAVVGATMLIVLRLLALSPWLARRVRLPLVAAGAAAGTAIFYTWLTGAEVPTVRSCIAALLVLAAIAIGREAITLRLVAAGALFVMLLWPEAVAGASFQLSFAAVTAIVALYGHPRVRDWFERREESLFRRTARALGALLLTGIVVELALMPFALFHFNKAGLYGALANIVAIPLTTFVVMPAELLALLFDAVGLGAPFWWVAGHALALLLWIARTVAATPGAVAVLPELPRGAFALMAGGFLWLALWQSRVRYLGLPLALAGALWAVAVPRPDVLVTGDGRHLAMRTNDGGLAILRDRAGDYVRDMLGEAGATDGALPALEDQAGVSCSRDVCLMARSAGGREWRILATRSGYMLPVETLNTACRAVDIVVSDRRLPSGCQPRWLRLDRTALRRTGGLSIDLASGAVRAVNRDDDRHPWVRPPRVSPPWPERNQ